MRRTNLVLGVLAALTLSLTANATAPANFAGTWVLDKSKTQNLPRQWENATVVTMEIKQDEKQISIETKAEGSQFPSQPLSYNLDGSESIVEMQGRRPGKATLKASWSKGDNTLELFRKQSGERDGTAFTIANTDKLTLAEEGKVLKIARTSEGPRGPQESTLIFNKKS